MVYTDVAMKLRTNIYLRPDQMKQLKALSEKTGAPIAELVRRAVDAYLAVRAKEK
jgi:predicted DNA-binding protein